MKIMVGFINSLPQNGKLFGENSGRAVSIIPCLHKKFLLDKLERVSYNTENSCGKGKEK